MSHTKAETSCYNDKKKRIDQECRDMEKKCQSICSSSLQKRTLAYFRESWVGKTQDKYMKKYYTKNTPKVKWELLPSENNTHSFINNIEYPYC